MNNIKLREGGQYEGGPFAKLGRLIEELGYNDGGNIKMAEVTSEYPDFRIRIEAETVEIPDEGIVCNSDLFQRTETVKINGMESTIEYPNKLVSGARVFIFDPEHGQLVYVLTMAE